MSEHRDVLSDEVRGRLARFGAALLRLKVPADDLAAILRDLDGLPPARVSRADREIARALGFFYPLTAYERADRYREMREILEVHPDLARLVIFHSDGYARQAALEALSGPAASPFAVAAIAYRLNDWVPQVRDAAEACAARVLPATDPEIMAMVALALLTRSRDWQRWGAGSPAFDEAVNRPAVLAHLVEAIARARCGAMGRVLRAVLPRPVLDPHLPRLAREAVLPAIRAVAYRCLIADEARWRTGYRREWVDKVYGLSRRVPVMETRPVATDASPEILIEAAARDRSALVRRVSADAAVMRRADLGNLERVMSLLASDKSAAVRERIAFIVAERSRT